MANSKPGKEGEFGFLRIQDGLQRAGWYVLEYTVSPVPPGGQPLVSSVRLEILPGPAAALQLKVRQLGGRKAVAVGEALTGKEGRAWGATDKGGHT